MLKNAIIALIGELIVICLWTKICQITILPSDDMAFAGHIVAVNGENISIELTSETDVHNGHVYIRENKAKDGYIVTKEDIGRPVVAFVRDPRTPKDVTDDILDEFLVF